MLPPISTAGYSTDEDVKELVNRVHSLIVKSFAYFRARHVAIAANFKVCAGWSEVVWCPFSEHQDRQSSMILHISSRRREVGVTNLHSDVQWVRRFSKSNSSSA